MEDVVKKIIYTLMHTHWMNVSQEYYLTIVVYMILILINV